VCFKQKPFHTWTETSFNRRWAYLESECATRTPWSRASKWAPAWCVWRLAPISLRPAAGSGLELGLLKGIMMLAYISSGDSFQSCRWGAFSWCGLIPGTLNWIQRDLCSSVRFKIEASNVAVVYKKMVKFEHVFFRFWNNQSKKGRSFGSCWWNVWNKYTE